MKQDARRRLLDAAISLIEESKSRPEDITVREICARAGVGISQINYHFQTKDNLIAQCVQEMIGDVIERVPARLATLSKGSAVETLKRMLLATFNFLYANENISRISILTDHQNVHQADNTQQTIDVYTPLVEAACKERNTLADPRLLTTILVLAFQGLFLRTDVVDQTLGIDLRSEDARERLIDEIVERLIEQNAGE